MSNTRKKSIDSVENRDDDKNVPKYNQSITEKKYIFK